MRATLLAASLLLAGCSDYGLTGQVDEDDPSACLDAPDTYVVGTDPDCANDPVIGQFDPTFLWSWSSNPSHPGYHQIMSAAVVGHATDDNADGAIDDLDTPDVVFTAFTGGSYRDPGALVVISGDDGHTHYSLTQVGGARPYGSSGVAIADLGDGVPVILVSSDQGLLAVDAPTGALRWIARVPTSIYGHASVADIDGDGLAEVIYGASVINADGTVRWTGSAGTGGGIYLSFAADLDGDGLAEIIAGNTVYEHDGTVRWTEGLDGFPAIGDLDGDGTPEIVTLVDGQIVVREVDGTLRWTFELDDGRGGPPTVADFDGDGLPDIGVASAEFYRVVRHDGTLLWRNPVQDRSSARTGSSVFDFEGDGAAEVVYADEIALYVWDGATGTEQLHWSGHTSGTLFEYPIVVDVNGDGASEIVVPSNNYSREGATGITVIGDSEGTWAPARKVWNQHAWHITNARDDGSIPPGAPGNWHDWNSFRAGNSETARGLALPDLVVFNPQACTQRCLTADLAEIWIRVENRGEAPAGPFWVTALREGENVDHSRFRSEGLAAGSVGWYGPLELHQSDLDAGGVQLIADHAGQVDECSTGNNHTWIRTWPCVGVEAEER